jgi:thiamine transporter
VWFFAEYAPVGTSPIVYSAIYNGSYLVVELIVSEIIMAILVWRKTLDLFL